MSVDAAFGLLRTQCVCVCGARPRAQQQSHGGALYFAAGVATVRGGRSAVGERFSRRLRERDDRRESIMPGEESVKILFLFMGRSAT